VCVQCDRTHHELKMKGRTGLRKEEGGTRISSARRRFIHRLKNSLEQSRKARLLGFTHMVGARMQQLDRRRRAGSASIGTRPDQTRRVW